MLIKKEKQWKIDRGFKLSKENEIRLKNILICIRPVKYNKKTEEQAIKDAIELGALAIRNGSNQRGKEGYEQSTATLPRSFGLIGQDPYETSEVADCYLDQKIRFSDLLVLQLLKKEFIYNDDESGEILHPVQILLKVLVKIFEIDKKEAWIDAYDYFYFLTEIKKSEEIDEVSKKIINSHKNINRVNEYKINDFDMWTGALLTSELLMINDDENSELGKIRYGLNLEEIDFIRWLIAINLKNIGTSKRRHSEEEQRRFGMVNTSIVSDIPKFEIDKSLEFELDAFNCEREMIKLYLFDGLSYREIEKSIFGEKIDGRGIIASSILNSFGIKDIGNKKGILAPFKTRTELLKLSMNDIKDSKLYKTLFGASNLLGYNKIYYGIPGCGKSYYVENTVLKNADKEHDVFRTTFYLDYSNSDFIGQVYPSVNDQGDVTYIHVPGPFTDALERALLNKDRMIYLVIEEINRGNAAAIFGDTFQLLDRLKEDSNERKAGDSEYPIKNTFIEDYFDKRNKELESKNKEKIQFKKGQIYIPHNLTLLATMNTSDQNVFPLDTAFKRRWDREKVVTNWDDVGHIKDMYVPYTDITWKEFATTVNDAILSTDSASDIAISEDKQMGAYFVQKNMLTEMPNTQDKDALITFTSNVIDYLYNDVTKFDHSLLFEKSVNSYDKLYDRINHYETLVVDDENSNVGKNVKVLSEFFGSKIIDKLASIAKEQGNNDEQGTEN